MGRLPLRTFLTYDNKGFIYIYTLSAPCAPMKTHDLTPFLSDISTLRTFLT